MEFLYIDIKKTFNNQEYFQLLSIMIVVILHIPYSDVVTYLSQYVLTHFSFKTLHIYI